MYKLTKSITSDFPLGITHHHLIREIIANGVNYCKEAYQEGDDLIINFTADYTADLATINSVIANYKPVPSYFDDLKFVTVTTSGSPYQIITKSVKCDTTGGNITILLPKAQRSKKGIFAIQKIATANTVTITPNGVETINGGSASLELTDNGSYYTLTNDGSSNWSSLLGNKIDTSVNNTLVETTNVGDLRIDNGDGLAPLHVGADNQVLIADSTQPLKMRWGNVAGGDFPACTEINASTIVTTTSSTYVLINGMTVTPTAGNYLVIFSASGISSNSSALIDYGVCVANVLIASSERRFRGSNSTTHTMYTQAKITVNGSETVEIRIKTSSGTFTINNRNMVLISVA